MFMICRTSRTCKPPATKRIDHTSKWMFNKIHIHTNTWMQIQTQLFRHLYLSLSICICIHTQAHICVCECYVCICINSKNLGLNSRIIRVWMTFYVLFFKFLFPFSNLHFVSFPSHSPLFLLYWFLTSRFHLFYISHWS